MSADLQWMMIRNNSCFLMKRKSVKQFSKVRGTVRSAQFYWMYLTPQKFPSRDTSVFLLCSLFRLVDRKGIWSIESSFHFRFFLGPGLTSSVLWKIGWLNKAKSSCSENCLQHCDTADKQWCGHLSLSVLAAILAFLFPVATDFRICITASSAVCDLFFDQKRT